MPLHVPERYRIKTGPLASDLLDGNNGAFFVPSKTSGRMLSCVASDGFGWEHVSVSLKHRVPMWEELCEIKRLFWDPEDWVVQFHPAESEYINNCNTALHLWRSTGAPQPTPSRYMVGFTEKDRQAAETKRRLEHKPKEE